MHDKKKKKEKKKTKWIVQMDATEKMYSFQIIFMPCLRDTLGLNLLVRQTE